MQLGPMEVIVDLRPSLPATCESGKVDLQAEFQVAVRLEFTNEGRSLNICVGNSIVPRDAGTVRSYPLPGGSAAATILSTNRNEDSMQAALSAARRFALKYRVPITLSYPAKPLRSSTDPNTFALLEGALRHQIDLLFAAISK